MANNSGIDEEMNQSEEPRTPLKRPVLKNDTGFAMVWTPEEQATLDNALLNEPKDASKYSCVSRYARISLEFPNKTTKDIAMRCRWIKELGRVKAGGSNSAPQDAVTDEVINQNAGPACKRLFLARVKRLQVGEWRFHENFSFTPTTGKYRPTSHKFKLHYM